MKNLKLREPVNGLTHLFSAALALIGLVLLLLASAGQTLKQISVGVYGVSLVALFTASAIYHLADGSERVMGGLRKFDHAAIYVLIAGTYTPVCLNFLGGFLRWGFLAFIWVFAITGVIVKLFVIKAPRWVTAGIYLVMGWMAILVVKPLMIAVPTGGLIWLAAGGLLFTIGAVIYITKKLDFIPGVFGFHEIWHIFVSLGCLCHFILIYQYIAVV